MKGDLILPSGVSVLDRLLNGGLPTGKFIHVYGEAASGKTTLALQFVSAAFRIGVDTIYVNSETGSPVERLEQISGKKFSEIESRLRILSPKDFIEQGALIDDIDLYARKDTKLVVVDTLTRLYRSVLDDRRTNYSNHRELNRQAGMLKGLAVHGDLAVLVLNQVRGSMSEMGRFEPVAKDIMDYWSDYVLRARLGKTTGQRILDRTRPEGDPAFCILYLTEQGLAAEQKQ
ncbi:MAG: ATPase domain-containing protein [Candidatus Thorarchaeota archaeon]